ncbi:MAG: YceI family protein [Bacteroidetes bacterium]|nr:YceI family protein [Bacteroidota bacterium]
MKLNKKIITHFSIVIIFVPFFSLVKAQDTSKIRYVTLPGSKLWFEGTSNIDEFTCSTHQVNGFAEIFNDQKLNPGTLKKDKVVVTVLVHTLDCGKDMMNEDMYNAMKADKFPDIKYELIEAHLSSRPDSTNWFSMQTHGTLYIAGEKNVVDIKFKVEKLHNGNFRLLGGIPLSMLDYGIVPPTHFFGLIRANKNLIVRFDLLAGRENNVAKAAQQNTLIGK